MKNNDSTNKKTTARSPNKWNYVMIVFIVLLVIASLTYIFLTQNQEPDPASEAIIRYVAAAQLNKDPNDLNDEDFTQIRELTLSIRAYIAAKQLHKKPSDLTSEDTYQILDYITKNMKLNYSAVMSVIYLELSDFRLLNKFRNLQSLTISSVRLPEKNIPRWMKILEKLGIYNLSERFYIDLSPLKNLSGLNTLSLDSSHVKNIKPLSKLINLKELKLNGTKVSDLEPIKDIQNLDSLFIRNCPNITDEQVEDLQKALPNLQINR